MAMSPPPDNDSNQRQRCDEDKTNPKALFNQSSVAVNGVCGDGKACFSTAASVIHNMNLTAEGRSDGFSATVDDERVGGKPFVKISVPVKNGHTTVNVRCNSGNVEQMQYDFKPLDDQYPKHMTKLRVKKAPPLVDTMQTYSEVFFDAVENLEETYNATLSRFNKGCLCLEFEHASAKKAQEMVDGIHNVTRIFKNFAQKCGFPSENVTVEAEYQFVEQPDDLEEKSMLSGWDTIQFEEAELDSQSSESENNVEHGGRPGSTRKRVLRRKSVEVSSDVTDPPRKKWTPKVNRVSSTASSDTGVSSVSSGSITYSPKRSNISTPVNSPRRSNISTLVNSPRHSNISTPVNSRKLSNILTPENSPIFHNISTTVCRTVSLDISSDKENMSHEVKQKLIGLRNGGGGRLTILRKQKEISADFLDCFLPECMDACLLDDEFCDDVYTVEEEEDVTTIDVQKCSKLITLDYHSKIARGKDLINLNRRQMIELIHGRHRQLTSEAKIRGKSHDLKNGKTVAFKQEGDPEIVTDTSQFVKQLFADLNLTEYISAFSKNKEGGSYILPLKVSNEQEIKSSLHDHVMENMIFLDTSHDLETRWSRPPDDLTTIVFHPPEGIQGKHLLEVSVKPFHGIVFYDNEGPESYKMNDQGQLVRLTKEEWLDRMSE